VISGPGRRLLDDVLGLEDGTFLALHAIDRDGTQGLTLFDRGGARLASTRVDDPLRLLLAVDDGSVRALTRRGGLATVKLPW
jgi:hypothetical protein